MLILRSFKEISCAFCALLLFASGFNGWGDYKKIFQNNNQSRETLMSKKLCVFSLACGINGLVNRLTRYPFSNSIHYLGARRKKEW